MNPTLAWIVVLVTACAGGVLVFALLGRRGKAAEPVLPTQWPLTPRSVFSPHERRFHRQVREALPEYVVLAKLPLVRFCHPSDGTQVRYWFDLLGAIHVGFAVCAQSGRILAAIDLDDDERSEQRRSVLIKKAVLAACHIRYVRYRPTYLPSLAELQLLVPASAGQPGAPVSAPPPGAGRATPSNGTHGADALGGPTSVLPSRWPDSTFAKDSTFGRDSVISGFSHSRPSELPETGGEVIDAPAAPRRRGSA